LSLEQQLQQSPILHPHPLTINDARTKVRPRVVEMPFIRHGEYVCVEKIA
jgi:hypothetical protein